MVHTLAIGFAFSLWHRKSVFYSMRTAFMKNGVLMVGMWGGWSDPCFLFMFCDPIARIPQEARIIRSLRLFGSCVAISWFAHGDEEREAGGLSPCRRSGTRLNAHLLHCVRNVDRDRNRHVLWDWDGHVSMHNLFYNLVHRHRDVPVHNVLHRKRHLRHSTNAKCCRNV